MTNPDNVGGLPPLSAFQLAVFRDWMTTEQSDQLGADIRRWLIAYGELCRAAPAGGDGVETLLALVPRPAMAHHKMDEAEEREIKRVNRFRDHVISNIRAYCATRELCRAAPAGGDETKGDWDDWFKTWAKARGMTMQLTEDGRFLCPDTSLAQKAHEAGCMVSHMYYLELCRQEELANSAPAGSGEVDSNTVRQALKSYMSSFGTQRQFAKSHGVSESYVSDVLRGHRNIPEEWVSSLGFRTVWVGPAALLRKLQQGAE